MMKESVNLGMLLESIQKNDDLQVETIKLIVRGGWWVGFSATFKLCLESGSGGTCLSPQPSGI